MASQVLKPKVTETVKTTENKKNQRKNIYKKGLIKV